MNYEYAFVDIEGFIDIFPGPNSNYAQDRGQHAINWFMIYDIYLSEIRKSLPRMLGQSLVKSYGHYNYRQTNTMSRILIITKQSHYYIPYFDPSTLNLWYKGTQSCDTKELNLKPRTHTHLVNYQKPNSSWETEPLLSTQDGQRHTPASLWSVSKHLQHKIKHTTQDSNTRIVNRAGQEMFGKHFSRI